MGALHLSEDATSNRIEAARCGRRFPVVIEMLEAGTLSPTTARLLARRLTPENHERLLAAAAGKSKQGVERLLAGLFPEPDVKAMVRAVSPGRAASTASVSAPDPQPIPHPADAALPKAQSAGALDSLAASHPHKGLPAARPERWPVVRPLSAERYEIRFTAGAETRAKLRRAQDLLGHAVPSGDLAAVFDRALTLLVADLERRKLAAAERPRPGGPVKAGSRHVPAEVRRAVWRRDQGRCAFTTPAGRRCDATRALEFHHVSPFAAGGPPTAANVQLRCPAHNRHEAGLYFGPIWAQRDRTPSTATARPAAGPEADGSRSPVPERVTRPAASAWRTMVRRRDT
jgi:hypothetical protein